jgi:Mg-chelatase subunit ChlI
VLHAVGNISSILAQTVVQTKHFKYDGHKTGPTSLVRAVRRMRGRPKALRTQDVFQIQKTNAQIEPAKNRKHHTAPPRRKLVPSAQQKASNEANETEEQEDEEEEEEEEEEDSDEEEEEEEEENENKTGIEGELIVANVVNQKEVTKRVTRSQKVCSTLIASHVGR